MEVDGKRTENETEFCVPCQTDGVTTNPDGFCKDCEEFMCQQCFKYHLRVKSCRNHVLSNTDDGYTTALQLTQGGICGKHINETIKFYCRQHDFVGCGDCMIPDHCACKPEVIREIATDFEQSLELKGMLRQVYQWDVKISEIDDQIIRNRWENKLLIDNAVREVKRFREDINNYIERVEKEIMAEAYKIASENDELMSQLEDNVSSASQQIIEIREALDTGRLTAEHLFIRMIENKAKVREVDELVADVKRKNSIKAFTFEPAQKLKELLASDEKFGRLIISYIKKEPSIIETKPNNENKRSTDSPSTTDTTSEKPEEESRVNKIQLDPYSKEDGNGDCGKHKQELYEKTRSILKKLTPQNFQTLVSQMQALPIDSEDKLKGVVDLVFEKAISEPGFIVAYANMCRCLSMFKVPSESKSGEMVNFRAVLLWRCQREFEKDKLSEAVFVTKREEIDKAEKGAKKEELKVNLEYEESKAKMRSLENIRFIGELFKLKMLTENVMHDCVYKLLRTKDPENLECLCRLLTTIGKELDVDKAKPRMDQYFNQMSKIVNDKDTVSRVRFMLQDVMDLRTNKWVPRSSNPNTIDHIHKEVAQEAQEKIPISQQNHMAASSQGRGGRGGFGRRVPPGQIRGSQDGWNTVASNRAPLKSVDRSIDPSKIQLSKQNVDESAIQLGSGGGASRFAGWGRGSTGGTTGRPSQENEKPNTPAKRFSAISRPEEESGRRYSGGGSPFRGGRGFGRPPHLSARLSQESERERAVAAAKAIGSSQSVDGSHRERSRGRAEQECQPSPAQPSSSELKLLSAEEMKKKTKAILDEYFAVQDMKEAILCVKELSAQNHHQFVLYAINHVLERSSTARKQTGHVLHDLVKQKVISVDNYIKGLVEDLEFAEGLEIDIPKIWQYYGEMISPMIQDNSVPLSFLKQAAQPLIANNKAGVLLAEILHDASHREGHKKVAGLWTSSGLDWLDFVPKSQVEQFLKNKGLEFINGGDSTPITPATVLLWKDIETKLNDLIVQKKADNEKVFDWIEGNFDEPTTKQPKFIRALMTAVCTSAIKGEKGKERLEPKEISNRNDLLQKYLDHQAEIELQALYALQALITKLEHPQGILKGMFETLYDEDIISEDAFFKWEKSEEEPEGKGFCLKQVVTFFSWLRESDDYS